MNVLFISRAYPPVIGGIETQNYEISQSLSRIVNTTLIVNRRGKKFIPIFLFAALFKLIVYRRRYDIVLLGDGVLSILAFCIKIFSSKPVVCIVHGLDITYRNYIYQLFWVGYFLKKVDKYIAVGNEVILRGMCAGLEKDKFIFIPNGIPHDYPAGKYSKNNLAELLGYVPSGPVLLTLGRLIKRKGVAWFVETVIPELDPDITYLIAGRGKEEENIFHLIEKHKLADRVKLLGEVSEAEKEILLSTADLLVQPNIPVKNDIEGFGIVVLEAGRHATFVVASDLEGLKDAITNGRNGLLIGAGDWKSYKQQIENLLSDHEALKAKSIEAQKYVLSTCSWDNIAEQYLSVLEEQYRIVTNG